MCDVWVWMCVAFFGYGFEDVGWEVRRGGSFASKVGVVYILRHDKAANEVSL